MKRKRNKKIVKIDIGNIALDVKAMLNTQLRAILIYLVFIK